MNGCLCCYLSQPNKPVQMLMSIKSVFLLLDFQTNGNLKMSSDVARTDLSKGKTSPFLTVGDFSQERKFSHFSGYLAVLSAEVLSRLSLPGGEGTLHHVM